MKFSSLTQFHCDTHNPLLMYRGCNPIPEKVTRQLNGKENPNLHFYKEFHNLYQAATNITASKNIVFGLEADFSDTDCGIGGFSEAGYIPLELFKDGLRGDKDDEIQKSLEFYWPRCPQSGKFMRFLASINLGIWPRVLHDSISYEGQAYRASTSRVLGYDLSKTEDFRNIYESDIWMHLFVSEQSDFETFNPDCHVRMTTTDNFDKMETGHAEFSRNYVRKGTIPDDKLKEILIAFQKANCVESEFICGPNQFFTNIRPRFQFDGLGKMPQRVTNLRESDNPNVFGSWRGSGDCSIFGRPRSQQTERRYISPDSYNGVRALTPMFSFTDQNNDITHQFYADATMMDGIRHKTAFCKLDSSNT